MIGARTFTNKTRTEDIQCIVLARLGFSTKTIASRTGLSPGAISYRLKLLNVKISDYRNGRSELSQRFIEAASADSARLMDEIKQHISKVLPPSPL
mgnify:CR=1 FL=1